MPLVAGVDSSTSGCKIEVRDVDTGALVSRGRASHAPTTPPRSEQRPDNWRSAFDAAAHEAGVFDRHRPAALSVAGQQHGLVVLGDKGQVLRHAKLWNDTESAEDAAALVNLLDAGSWAEACGSVPVASFTITKLRWLKRQEPDVFARVARVLLPHDWLTHGLTGEFVTDRGDASGTGWWSPAEERYRTDLLDLVDDTRSWDDVLPRVLGPSEAAGEWSGTIVGPGTGDNMAAALGLGMRSGDLALSLGTSGTAYTVSAEPTSDATGTVAGFADASGQYLPLVCTLNATKVSDTVARLLGVTASELDQLALGAPAGAGGLVLVPHLDGERTPNRPEATGTLVGIRSDASREGLARAAIEGVVCNLLAGAERLPDSSRRLFVVGGGARSHAYRQVVADLTGRPVLVPDADELVAFGAAVQAAAVLTGEPFEAITDRWDVARGASIEPNPGIDGNAIREAYDEACGA